MDMNWITEQLHRKGMNRRQLAAVIPGMTETKLSLSMSGARKLSAAETDAIRRFFGYRLPDDPQTTLADVAADQLASLGDSQLRSVILYLEALTGDKLEHLPTLRKKH